MTFFHQSYVQTYTAINKGKGAQSTRPSERDFHKGPWGANTRVLANGLQSIMEHFSFIVSLVVVKEILAYLSAITTALQGDIL